MRIPKRSRTRGGFTLTELMITVALIGVIAAIAIPNFLTYQARSRRSEGFTNVAGHRARVQGLPRRRGTLPGHGRRNAARRGRASRPRDLAAGSEHDQDALGHVRPRTSSRSSAGGPTATSSTATTSSLTACGGGCTDRDLLHGHGARRRRRQRQPRRGDVRPPADGRRGRPDRGCNSAIGNFPAPAPPPPRARAAASTTSPPSDSRRDLLLSRRSPGGRESDGCVAAEGRRTVALVRARRGRHGARAREHGHAVGGGERAPARAEPRARARARVRLRARDRRLLLDPGAPAGRRRAAPRAARTRRSRR